MNADANTRIPYWVWIPLIALLFTFLGVIIAFPGDDEERIGTDDAEVVSIDDKSAAPPEALPPAMPLSGSAQLTGTPHRSLARVTISPRSSGSSNTAKPNKISAVPKITAPKKQLHTSREARLRIPMPTPQDMLPRGAAIMGSGPKDEVASNDSLPDLAYNDKNWKFSGNYVETNQIDVTKMNETDADGKKAYAMKDGSKDVLFVQDNSAPNKMAVYR